MAEVTKLKDSRRAQRIHANRLIAKRIFEYEFQVAELKAFKENYEHQFSKIQTLDDDIISHLEEDAVEEEHNLYYFKKGGTLFE